MAAKEWKKGRGKLGLFAPLIGTWSASSDSPMGPVHCTRTFERVLGNTYVQLTARWHFGKDKNYEELALFGVDTDARLTFWSFTSDGKSSRGKIADVTDIHPQALGFEAQMPAGLARQAIWPEEEEGFCWVVEAKTNAGWSRFTQHHYRRIDNMDSGSEK